MNQAFLPFLRLFAAFRDAEVGMRLANTWAEKCKVDATADREAMHRENAAKLQAQDRVRDLEAENARLLTELTEARGKTIRSTEMVADFFSQQLFGRKVYADTPTLPEHPQEPEMIQRPRSQARTDVDEATRQFYAELYDAK